MIFPACQRLFPGLLLLVLCAAGCIPTRDGTQDEQREPNFLRGQELRKQLDHQSAAEAFERALEANPRSAAAHFELGLLFEQHLNEPATAIYHFERYLKLLPKSDKAEIVRQRASNCKMELAKLFLIAPNNAPSAQKELDKLKAEVERLSLENNQLRRQLETFAALPPARSATPPPSPAAVVAASAVAAAPPAKSSPTTKPAPTPPRPAPVTLTNAAPAPTPKPAKATAPTATARTHSVKKGDIPETIAKQYSVKLEALLTANPGLDPKRMKIGQTVTIPSP
ncbi:MAG: hypothetical protein RL514_2614 [Verrucomicrobiota bacterium]|jgi:tetratricopeptide (TPR) repeat protein